MPVSCPNVEFVRNWSAQFPVQRAGRCEAKASRARSDRFSGRMPARKQAEVVAEGDLAKRPSICTWPARGVARDRALAIACGQGPLCEYR